MDMDVDKLKMIHDLMGDLIGDMDPSVDDFDERLGKPKPDATGIVIAAKGDGIGDDPMDGSMGPNSDDMLSDDGSDMPMSEDDKLKQRLLKLKG